MKKRMLFTVLLTCFGAGISCGKNNNPHSISKKNNEPQPTSTENNEPQLPEETCLYIADKENHKIRKVDPQGVITHLPVIADLKDPHGVAIDSSGNVFISDTRHHKIWKLTPEGIMTTYAGNGYAGKSGDGGPATDAKLHVPTGLTVDSMGNIYIADSINHKIRKVGPHGIITTIAGNGGYGLGYNGGRAIDETLHSPYDVAVDSSRNLYIANNSGFTISKVDVNGIIVTVAGTDWYGDRGDGGEATHVTRLDRPHGVAIDSMGNLYIADTQNHKVRKVDPQGIITAYVGKGTEGNSGDGGPSIDAELRFPNALAIDSSGNLYIADSGNRNVRKVDPQGIITTIVGPLVPGEYSDGRPVANLEYLNPTGLAVGKCR